MDRQGFQRVYDEFVTGTRILPGMWRPHAPWEQVAWVHPPWPDDGYLWLDFPEVVMVEREFLYAGHGPLDHPSVHHDALPKAPWYDVEDGIAFDRIMPNGLAFGGRLTEDRGRSAISMQIYVCNGTPHVLRGLKMQTCAYLRLLDEFADKTTGNKYVHVAERGWVPFPDAAQMADGIGPYRLGWRGGPAVADLPFMVTVSGKAERLLAMTWYDDTYSIVSNPGHPCIHTDPAFPDIEPGGRYSIRGELFFFEGTLADFGREVGGG